MNKPIQVLISLILIFSFCHSLAQDKPIIAFTEDDGLANNEVHDVTRDNLGYLWIATGNGLSRYDGENFVNYRVQQGLPGNMVRAVAHDGNNRIFAACYKAGLAIIEKDRVVKTLHIKAFENDKIRKLYFSKTHRLLFLGSDFGIYALKDSTFFLLSRPNGPNNQSSILSITELNGIIYFTVYTDFTQKEKGFYKIDINSDHINDSKVTHIIGGNLGFGCTMADSSIYVNLDYDIYKYQPNSGEVSKIARIDTLFLCWAMSPLGSNKIVLGGRSEDRYVPDIKILDLKTNSISKSPFNIKTPDINSIVYDKRDKYTWFCCDRGLYCYMDSPFEIYNITDKTSILDIAVIKDSLYVMTEDHIWLLGNGGNRILYDKSLIERKVLEKSLEYSRTTNKKGTNILGNLVYDKKVKFLHFNTDGDQTHLLTYMGGISFPDLITYMPVRDGHFITDNTNRLLWSPPYNPLHYYKSVETSSEILPFNFGNGKPIINIKKIVRNGDIIYFASLQNGLYAIKGNQTYYLNSSNSQVEDILTDIETDGYGGVWCTSNTGDLYKIDFTDQPKIVKTFSKDNSEIKGDNYKWIKFSNHYFFVATNKGLNKIPINQLDSSRIDSVQFFNASNGYEYLSASSPVMDRMGNIYVFTPEKVIKIINRESKPPKLKITFSDLKVDNEILTEKKIQGIHFSSETKSISGIFSVIILPISNNVEYQYRVNEGEWLDGNKISLPSLKSGNYVITCRAKDHETSYAYQEVLSFYVKKPFWQTFWFLSLAVLILGAISYWIIYSRFRIENRIREEKARLTREMAELHMQSLQSQMNPHFVFNSLNSIQNFILSNKTLDAVTYLGTLGSLIRMNLEHVSKEYISLADELQFLEKYVEIEKMRFREDLQIDILTKIHDADSTMLPPMLIQPLVENSIKYRSKVDNQKGLIHIEFKMDHELMHVTVIDNGVGRINSSLNKANNHKSMGLSLIMRRLSILNEKHNTSLYQIDIEDLYHNGVPNGTMVKLTMPQFFSEN